MVTGACICVRLNLIFGDIREIGPARATARIVDDDLRYSSTPRHEITELSSRVEVHLRGVRRHDRLGRSLAVEVHRLVGHDPDVRRWWSQRQGRNPTLDQSGALEGPCGWPVRSALVSKDPDGKTEKGSHHSVAATRLVLVRHAVTPQTGPVLSGRSPGIDLSEDGIAQAVVVGARLANAQIAAVYSSPIERTLQTAGHIAGHHGLEVRVLDGVLEADYGKWTGKKIVDLVKSDVWKTVQVAPSRARFPGGETLAGMQARMVAALEDVVSQHAGETIVVVSHADPIKAAVAHFTGTHLDLFQRIMISPASVTVFELGKFGAVLVTCNSISDLAEILPAKTAKAE